MRFLERLPSAVLVTAAVLGVVAAAVLGVTTGGDDDAAPRSLAPPTAVVPSPVPSPPAGVRAERYAPADLGVTMQLPSGWVERDGEEGYAVVVEAPDDGSAFVLLDRRSITGAGDRVTEVERLGATLEAERTVDLDGFGAQILEYVAPFPGRGIATVTEIDIDLADGTYVVVVVAALDDGEWNPSVLEWIVETVRVAATSG